MRKTVKVGVAILMSFTLMSISPMTVTAAPRIYTVAANSVRLRQSPGLNGKLVAYLGYGNQMLSTSSTGVIDNQVWRYGVMLDNDVAGCVGYASAAYLR